MHYLVGEVILPLVTVGVTGVVALWTVGFRDLLGFSVWSIVSGFHVEDVTDPKKKMIKMIRHRFGDSRNLSLPEAPPRPDPV